MSSLQPPFVNQSRPPRPPSLKLLAGVVQSINEGVVVAHRGFERNGLRIRHVNDAMCEISGYTAADLVGEFHGILHTKRAGLPIMRRWHQRLPAADPLEGEGDLQHKHGNIIYVAWTLTALTDSRRRITHIVITYRDMTANRRLQDALIHSQRLDAVGRLSGGLAHDFNNLLTVINGYSEILHETIGPQGKGRDEILAIHQAAQRATILVRQLLAFSRRQELDPRLIEPNRLVAENAKILSRICGVERSLELDLDPHAKNILVDPAQIQQVILNLCINARDATGAGGHIIISTQNRTIEPGQNLRITDANPGDYVALSITENGSGMDEATRQIVFDPFFTTKGEGLGTGLGLALAHGVVTQSGGQIVVKSAPGQGATFEMLFPAHDKPAPATAGTLVPRPQTRGRENLILIEDDDVIRKMVADILTTDGYSVRDFTCTAQALHQLRGDDQTVHLVISDQYHDETEYRKFVKKLLRDSPEISVLITSRQNAHPFAFIPLKRQSSLPRPFALSTIIQEVRRLLDLA